MKQINNYHDLAVEKQRLKQRLELLKRDVDKEIEEIKAKFRPITKIASIFGIGDHPKAGSNGAPTAKQSLLKMGGNLAVDLLVGPKLAKAGLFTRLVVPPLLRTISNGIINRFKKKK